MRAVGLMKKLSVFMLGLFALGGLMFAQAQDVPPDQRFTEVQLFTESATVAPGQTFAVALKMTPEPGWHTYWINPGDAGMKTSINWELPEGFTASDIQFPAPEAFEFSELVNYGYGHANTLLIEMTAPQSLPDGPLTFTANAIWLVCDDALCIPEEDVFTFTLTPGDGAVDSASKAFFDEARAALPIPTSWDATYSLDGEGVDIFIPLPVEAGDVASAYVFPVSEDFLDHAAPQTLKMVSGGFEISTKLGIEATELEDLLLVLKTTADSPVEAFEFTATQAGASAAPSAPSVELDGLAEEELSLGAIFLFAIVGGAILNLMPCVFPVLSLKALSLAKTNGDEKAARESGIYYTVGILVSFAVVAAILLGIRGAGSAVGWGFQLQSPIFVGLMALLMFAVALNLFGFFEIGGRLAGVGSDWLAKLDGKSEAFVTGTLATIVATPCTGPFMAPVLAYALTQTYIVALAVFMALGFGLALPFIILAFVPATRSWMPRPGAWMQTFKQFLGFPMVATAIWLLYVLNSQAGPMAVFVALFAFLTIGVAVWAFKHVMESSNGALAWRVVAFIALAVSIGLVIKSEDLSGGPVAVAEADDTIIAYSAEALDERLSSGAPTFLYFTADWCITCKVNERTTLKTAEVKEAFEKAGVGVMVGDWTSRDEEIGAVLKRFGRVGIPFYVYFGPDGAEPVILGQLLTPAMLTELVKG